jgi:hypothetical protein
MLLRRAPAAAAQRARRAPGHVVRSITEWSEAAGNVAAGGPSAADLIGLIPTDAIHTGLQHHISTESVSQIISNIHEALNGALPAAGRPPPAPARRSRALAQAAQPCKHA